MDTHVTEWIYRLTDFAIAKGLIEAQDRAFYVNRLLEAMRMDAPEEIDYVAVPAPETATQMLDALAADAALLSAAERQAIDAAAEQVRAAAAGDDSDAIKEAIKNIDTQTQEFAARRMDQSVRIALKGQSVDEV